MHLKSEKENVRIDKYLSEVTSFSRELLTKMIMNGSVLVDHKKVKPSYKVKMGDPIFVDESFVKPMDVVPVEMAIDIVYEDDYLMVINKPSGLVVHPGAGNYNNTLVNGLMYYTQNLSEIGDEVRPGIVHRLDKDTSGLMLVAKTNEAHLILADDFKHKRVQREYIALLDGVMNTSKAFIDAPIGRDKKNFQKMAVMKEGKEARTHVEVIKKYKEYTLVRLVLETGRTHQIRVHMAYIGYPVFNDPVYGKQKCATEFGQFLHSEKIRFVHPITKKEMVFERKVPEYFQDFLDTLEENC